MIIVEKRKLNLSFGCVLKHRKSTSKLEEPEFKDSHCLHSQSVAIQYSGSKNS